MKLKRWHLLGLVILAAIITVAVMAYRTVWYLAIFIWIPALSGILGIILALVAVVWQRRKAQTASWATRVSQGLLLVGIFLILQFAYLPVALGMRDWEVTRAQNFIDTLIPKLEAYQREHNSYPASLQPVLADADEIPRLLQLNGDFPLELDNRQYYFQRGETYGFQFRLPDGFIGFYYEYCCGANGEWTVTD